MSKLQTENEISLIVSLNSYLNVKSFIVVQNIFSYEIDPSIYKLSKDLSDVKISSTILTIDLFKNYLKEAVYEFNPLKCVLHPPKTMIYLSNWDPLHLSIIFHVCSKINFEEIK